MQLETKRDARLKRRQARHEALLEQARKREQIYRDLNIPRPRLNSQSQKRLILLGVLTHEDVSREDILRQDRRSNKAIIAAHKAANACIDCGQSDPLVLEFDHRVRGQKSFNLSSHQAMQVSQDVLLAEIAKCDIRCANCHRKKTHYEGWGKGNP